MRLERGDASYEIVRNLRCDDAKLSLCPRRPFCLSRRILELGFEQSRRDKGYTLKRCKRNFFLRERISSKACWHLSYNEIAKLGQLYSLTAPQHGHYFVYGAVDEPFCFFPR
jgi:hypothetical protein